MTAVRGRDGSGDPGPFTIDRRGFRRSVGRPVAKTQSQKPTLGDATGYSQLAKWPLAVRSNPTASAGPMIFLDVKVGLSDGSVGVLYVAIDANR